VDTRLAELEANREWSAVLLATAGLLRLGLGHRIGERLQPQVMLPAPGQGALAVTARADDAGAIAAARAAVHHAPSALAVSAERAFLRRLEGGCQVPVAALATLEIAGGETTLRLHGRVISLGGDRIAEGRESALVRTPEDAERLGSSLAERLLREGASRILADARAGVAPVVSEP
jgi:hydroxymethylbilane synthase